MADLLSLTDGEELKPEADPGLVVGHLHLHVGDIDRALAFYRDLRRLRGDDAVPQRRLHRRRAATTTTWA